MIYAYLRWILPAIFMIYYGEIISFTHVHVVNGVTVVHAHPYKSGNASDYHHHSLSELQLFHQLSVFSLEDGAVQSLIIEPFIPLFLCYIHAELPTKAKNADIPHLLPYPTDRLFLFKQNSCLYAGFLNFKLTRFWKE